MKLSKSVPIPKRISFLIGKDTALDKKLGLKHRELIASGYYVAFRETLNSFYLHLRSETILSNQDCRLGNLTADEIKLATIQKLALATIHRNSFKKVIAYHHLSGKKVWFPVSIVWQRELTKLGLEFNRFFCHFLYLLTSVAIFLKTSVKFIADYASNGCKGNSLTLEPGDRIYFSGLNSANFPTKNNLTFNLTTWLGSHLKEHSTVYHDCKIQSETIEIAGHSFVYQRLPFQGVTNVNCVPICFDLLGYLFSRKDKYKIDFWQRLMVLGDLFAAILISRNPNQQNYSRIFFQSTVLVAKPLWASAAEKLGSEVILLHYAIASEPTLDSNPIIQDGIWQLNSWNSAWVVDGQQVTEISLSTAFPPSNYFEIGVPFWGGEGDLRELPKDFPIISVFDTDISAGTKFSAGKLDELGWNDRSLEVEFIEIILEAASSFKVTIAHKKKRATQDEFSRLRKTETLRLLELYSSHYQVVDGFHSSDLLISKSAMVISKPISTTAVAAKLMGIESIFLDPPGNIHPEDPSLRNLKILRNVAELKAVFAQHFEKL